MITPSISDSYAEYLRILLSRATDPVQVNTLREQITEITKALYEQHKEKVKTHGRRFNR